MNAPIRSLLAAALILVPSSTALSAQVLHTNDRWTECAFVIDPSLTQADWHQFVREVGLVAYFRPLASAKPLGARNVEVAVLQWATKIDDADAAWNNTFSHPDSEHYLFEGDQLPIPGLMVRVGVSDRVDVGAYATKSFGANYGIVGAQAQYNLVNDAARNYAVAARLSGSALVGPEDLGAYISGLDLVLSRDVYIFSPYVGVSGYLTHGREYTDKVNLDSETVLGAQGTVGVTAKVSVLRIGAEYNVAKVPGYSFKVAFGS